MARMNPGRFAFGLVAEITGIVVVVSLLPKVPWDSPALASREKADAADRRPSLSELPVAETAYRHNWQTAAPEPEAVPSADPAYVERRLDRAGQQLLEGVSTYFAQTAREVLQPASPGSQ